MFSGIMALSLLFVFVPKNAQAKECESLTNGEIVLQVAIPGVTKECTYETFVIKGASTVKTTVTKYYIPSLEAYISGVYGFFIGAVTLAAIVMIMIGGFQWVMAAGNQARIGNAKTMITSALSGLILALLSYTLLNAINPRITNLTITKPDAISGISQLDDFYCAQAEAIDDDAKLTPFSFNKEVECTGKSGTDCDKLIEDARRTKDNTECGILYKLFDEKGEPISNVCVGRACTGVNEGKACHVGKCVTAVIKGTINEGVPKGRFIDNDLELWALCKETTTYKRAGSTEYTSYKGVLIEEQDLDNSNLQAKYGYVFSKRPPAQEEVCSETLLGYYLKAEVDEWGAIDDWFMIGNDGSKPLSLCKNSKYEYRYRDGKCNSDEDLITDPNNFPWGKFSNERLKELLIPHEDIANGVVTIDLKITDTAFPAR